MAALSLAASPPPVEKKDAPAAAPAAAKDAAQKPIAAPKAEGAKAPAKDAPTPSGA